jgi:S-adenosylmethionine synthetase
MVPDMIFTSESVTAGHPDKLCDQISDAAIDAFLRQDPAARAIVECAIASGVIFLAARFAAAADVDLTSLARKVVAEAGYLDGRFDARRCSILTSFSEFPADGRAAATTSDDDAAIERVVAQDQANVFGYACRETPELMPAPISFAHRVARALDETRRAEGLDALSPDAKTQVSVRYRDGVPERIHAISIDAVVAPARRRELEEKLRVLALRALADCAPRPDAATEVHLFLDPRESFEVEGPARHAGLTGRKNGIDTYGEYARQSGAALSGKDPSRIDRIGAYAARHAAKNIVGAGLAERCEVHLGYTIGQARPLGVAVETFGTGAVSDAELARRLRERLDFRPAAVARRFALRTRPARAGDDGFYRRLALYGHVGRADLDLPWEATDVVRDLAAA